MQPILMNVQETAAALSASRSTVYRLIESGKLRPFKLGVATRFRREDVEAFAASLPTAEG